MKIDNQAPKVMLETTMSIVSFFIIICLCLNHYNTKKKLYVIGNEERKKLKLAAELSIAASATINPILALVDVTKAVHTMEMLHTRYGHSYLSSITNINTEEMNTVLEDQKERIIQDVLRYNQTMIPAHPLNKQAGLQES